MINRYLGNNPQFNLKPVGMGEIVDSAWYRQLRLEHPEIDDLPDAKPVELLGKRCAVGHALDGPNRMRDGACRACLRPPAKQLRRRKTHCPQGHSYAERGAVNSQGTMICLECKKLASRRHRAEKNRDRKPAAASDERPAHPTAQEKQAK